MIHGGSGDSYPFANDPATERARRDPGPGRAALPTLILNSSAPLGQLETARRYMNKKPGFTVPALINREAPRPGWTATLNFDFLTHGYLNCGIL